MRDIAGTNHADLIYDHPLYYSARSYHDLLPTDYYYSVLHDIASTKHHSAMGKFPWTYISFSGAKQEVSGWKIHISATQENHLEILKKAAEFAFENRISFKFATNEANFSYLNSKNINRASSGKFIVLYPKQSELKDAIERLYILLHGYEGPYILSDRAYKDSEVVFYRYAEINPISYTDPYGTVTTKILTPDNRLEVDQRLPYYTIPSWAEEPFPDMQVPKNSSILLQKYKITSSMHFSAQGGVYKAQRDGTEYVVKEARNHTGLDALGRTSIVRLRNEYKFLNDLKELNCAPKPVELIEDCGNLYLVEELIDGKSLHFYPSLKSPYVRIVRETQENAGENINKFVKEITPIFANVLRNIGRIHAAGIALGDISPGNILYNEESFESVFIDFEVAFYMSEYTGKELSGLVTPGFMYTSTDQTIIKQELYKIGLVLMHCIMPYNSIFMLTPNKVNQILSLFKERASLPAYLIELIHGLVNFKYNNAEEALLQLLKFELVPSADIVYSKPYEIDYSKLKTSIENNIMAFVNGTDILASDAIGIQTNKFCLASGVMGMLFALDYAKENFHEEVNVDTNAVVHQFMCSYYANPHAFQDGLFVGLSGIAYVLLKLGYLAEAMKMLNYSHQNNNMFMYDYTYGFAGRLAVELAFYKETKNEQYLHMAKSDAERIIANAKHTDNGSLWPDADGDFYTGFTRGCSGIAYSLLLLYMVTDDKHYLSHGIEALETDLSRIERLETGFIGFNNRPIGSDARVYSPYIHGGLTGLGTVLIRYYIVTRSQKYLDLIHEIIDACASPFILYPGYLRGASGMLSFYQDCKYLLNLNVDKYIDAFTELLRYHYVQSDELCGFAGDELFRISHDLYTGSSGVLVSHYRVKNALRHNPFLILDELFI